MDLTRMELRCRHCHEGWSPNKAQRKLIERLASATIPLAVFECPKCRVGNVVEGLLVSPDEEQGLRCPERGCSGFVSHIVADDGLESFWGCGACGVIWNSRAKLENQISSSVQWGRHRAAVYTQRKLGWTAVAIEQQPYDYEQTVLSELHSVADPRYEAKSKRRGGRKS
jgi:hypothetical protein